jgi:hypothetical protein
MATLASKRTSPSRRKRVKKGLKKSGAGKRSKKIDPRAEKRPVDPLPGDDPFAL